MKTITIDLEFAERYGICEALYLSILRRMEIESTPDRMRTHCRISQLYPLFSRAKYRKAMITLNELGYITLEERRLWKGKYLHYICRLTDKAFKEYRFNE